MRRPRALVVRSGPRSVLEDAGASPAGVEIVERVSHAIEPVDAAPTAGGADVVIFTSRVAVAQALAGRGSALRSVIAGARLVAVGAGTAAALREGGLAPEIVAGGSAEAVLATLPASLQGVRVLLPCGADASLALPEGLRQRGASVTRRVVYRKIAHPPDPTLASEILSDPPFAVFCATSPAAAAWLFDGLAVPVLAILRRTPAVALGPSTRAFLSDHGVERVVVAGEATFSAVLRLIEALATPAAGQ